MKYFIFSYAVMACGSKEKDTQTEHEDSGAESSNLLETNTTLFQGSCGPEQGYSDIGIELDMSGHFSYGVFYHQDTIGYPWVQGVIASGLNNTPLLSEDGLFCPGEEKVFDYSIAEIEFVEHSFTIYETECSEEQGYVALDFELDLTGNHSYEVFYKSKQIGHPWIHGPIFSGLNNTPMLTDSGLFCPGEGKEFEAIIIERNFSEGYDNLEKNIIEGTCEAADEPYYLDIELELDMSGSSSYDVFFQQNVLGYPWIHGPVVFGLNKSPLLTDSGLFCPGDEYKYKIIEWHRSEE